MKECEKNLLLSLFSFKKYEVNLQTNLTSFCLFKGYCPIIHK